MFIVDKRGEDSTASYFALAQKEPVTRDMLPAGDVWFSGNGEVFGIELKSVSDLMRSAFSREHGDRLEWQLGKLRQEVDKPILGIHGVMGLGDGQLDVYAPPMRIRGGLYYPNGYVSKVPLKALEGLLWSVGHPSEGVGVEVMWRPNKECLLEGLVEVFEWSKRAGHGTFQHTTRFTGMGRTVEDRQVNMLCAIGKMGEGRARALLKRFGSPLAVFSASDEELMGERGIGKGLVAAIREVCSG